MSQEARFLQAHEARMAALSSHQHRPRHELHNLFWSSFRKECNSWQEQLDDLVEQYSEITILASQKTQILEKLDALQTELQNMSHKSIKVELPVADVRILHKELTGMSTRLEQVRTQLIPPTKFTFTKYRAAMQQLETKDTISTPTTTTTSRTRLPCYSGNVVRNYENFTIIIDSDGSVRVQANDCDEPVVFCQQESSDSSLLLKDVKHCNITINGTYKALYIANVVDCTIRVTHAMKGGAIHVTCCQNLEIYAVSCHQLRIHDSQELKIQVIITTSGPILEDSTKITFYGDHTSLDVKDFNWLRNGVPSPNYNIVVVQEEALDLSKEVPRPIDSSPVSGDDEDEL